MSKSALRAFSRNRSIAEFFLHRRPGPFESSWFERNRCHAASAGSATDWTSADHDFNGTRYSPLTQITPGNVVFSKVCSYTFPKKCHPNRPLSSPRASLHDERSLHSRAGRRGLSRPQVVSPVPRDKVPYSSHRGAALTGKLSAAREMII
jgi:hypothetical protein